MNSQIDAVHIHSLKPVIIVMLSTLKALFSISFVCKNTKKYGIINLPICRGKGGTYEKQNCVLRIGL